MTSSADGTPGEAQTDAGSIDTFLGIVPGGGRENGSDRFISLFAENQHAIYAYTRTLVPNRSDAEDIMQNVSVTLWKKWHTFDPSTNFLRWAFAVAFIEILRHRRKMAKDRLWFSEPLLELLSSDMQQNAEAHCTRLDALSMCLEKLDGEDRRLIDVRYRQGGSAQLAADEYNKPLSTIYKKLLRVRQALRNCINRTIATQSHPTDSFQQ